MQSIITLADRMAGLEASATLALTASAKALQKQGIDIIVLAAGEPDVLPPDFLMQALQKAIWRPESCAYTTPIGLEPLRQAIAEWLQKERGIAFDPGQIVVTAGCKMAIFQTLFSILNPGDEVLFGQPYWVSYPQMTLACQGRPVPVPTTEESRFLLSAKGLTSFLSERSKVIILNSPHNPTGQYYKDFELVELATCIRQHPNLIVICDDIYDSLTPKKIPHILNVAPDLKDRVVVINGLSKSFGVTGWRLGFAAGPKILIDAVGKAQSQIITSVSTPIQYAAIEAYTSPEKQKFFQASAKKYYDRIQLMTKILSSQSQIKVLPADASFYLWVDVQAVLAKHGNITDWDLAKQWVNEARVAVIPGGAFGMPGYMRLSVTQPEERLIEAAKRLVHWINLSMDL